MQTFFDWIGEPKPWYLFGETATLYHGTSSALLSNIQTEGLKPPDENLETYVNKLILQYLENPPKELRDEIVSNNSYRKNAESQTLVNAIYLDGSFKEASNYAEHYYRFGGEIAFTVWRTINRYVARQQGKKPDNETQYIAPIYNKSYPVVVEVQIPWKWMNTYRDLKTTYFQAISFWRVAKSGYKDFGDYLKKAVESVEIRVKENIPPKMIKQVHPLQKPSNIPGSPES